MKCTFSRLSNVTWKFYAANTENHVQIISSNGRILPIYNKRFALGSTDDEYHNLIIHRVKPTDAGLYVASENNGTAGQSHYVFLTIYGRLFVVVKCKMHINRCFSRTSSVMSIEHTWLSPKPNFVRPVGQLYVFPVAIVG